MTKVDLKNNKTWLVTGVAGFIGSHLLQELLSQNQTVVGVDNFITGKKENLTDVQNLVSKEQWSKFSFFEADIRDKDSLKKAIQSKKVDIILHQAALGSITRSIEDPMNTHTVNADGTLQVFLLAKEFGIKRVVYASSSSVYGDHPKLPKVESETGNLLSPYAISKAINELYAKNFHALFGLETVGLRYFNVFGARQDPNGPYAAVIPRWIDEVSKGKTIEIYGDGETSRDFCYIKNVVSANLLAATTENKEAFGQAFNVAAGDKTTLNELFKIIQTEVQKTNSNLKVKNPEYKEFRAGDIRHSLADLSKIKKLLHYKIEFDVKTGLKESVQWYLKN